MSRKERYAQDPEYRNTAIERSRQNYQRTTEQRMDPRENLEGLLELGVHTEYRREDGTTGRRVMFSKAMVAELLGVKPKAFYEWVNDGRFPQSVVEGKFINQRVRDGIPQQLVQWTAGYTLHEVRAAIEALGPHLSTMTYYRQDHQPTRKELFRRVTEARVSIGWDK